MSRHQDPVKTGTDSALGDSYEHPAFAQIRASRISGGTYLYGSDFKHHHYVTVRISGSVLMRNLSNEWHFDRSEMIEVAMSEAQWATFVSSLNVGGGVPCTLQHLEGKPVPQLKPPAKNAEKFSADLKATMQEIQADLKKIAQALVDGDIGKTKAKELQNSLQLISARLTGSTGFVADQFDEHMERTVERAKVEVNAYVVNQVQKAGLDALGVRNEVILLEHKESQS